MSWNQVKLLRDRLAREEGAVLKDWGGKAAIALAYPNSYYLGMSNLGLQTIYDKWNSLDHMVCERIFWEPPPEGPAGYLPLSVESQRPPTDFGMLAFSISYELDFFNVPRFLRAAGIPERAVDREEGHPLVICGGPCATANPEPLSLFFDAFVVGEGEPVLCALAEVAEMAGDRDAQLSALSQMPGVYVPLVHRPLKLAGEEFPGVVRQLEWDMEQYPTMSRIYTRDTELGDLGLMEIARGCGRGCRFCLVGYLSRPPRFRSMERLLEDAREALCHRERIGLVGPIVSDHPQLEELVLALRAMGAKLSFSSLRTDNLSPVVVRALAESGTRTVTIAPEAGSERLRRFINKGVTAEDCYRAADLIGQHGVKQAKMYFMVGLPTETDEDIVAMADLALACKARLDRRHPGSQVTLNVSPFVPKPFTPLQWAAMTSPAVITRRLNLLRARLKPRGVQVRADSPQWYWVEGILSRGDHRLGEVLAHTEETSLGAWQRAAQECAVDVDSYIDHALPMDAPLPWSVVDAGMPTKFFRMELGRAQRLHYSHPCPPTGCKLCGVC
ncbi:MAG: radical SAM protein [Chloroflexi bacterium]|nr:radical SAM protein [Chloroflexota bacterium]